MVDPKEVSRYSVNLEKTPWLWKAQRSFLSAEALRQKRCFDCAANRYYYAVLQTASHFFAGQSGHLAENYNMDHNALTSNYVREHDRNAQEAISRAQSARNKGDYSPLQVEESQIVLVFPAVAGMMTRAMQKVKEKEK